jgi:hypothetical protein
MTTIYPNIGAILNESVFDIVGLGWFTYGTSELWYLLDEVIIHILKKYNSIDIFFDDIEPLIVNLNNIIQSDKPLIISDEYNGLEDFPLDNYISNRSYDSIELLSFIQKLRDYNENYKVNIYGVKSPLTDSKMDLLQFDDKVKMFHKKFPKFKNTKAHYHKWILGTLNKEISKEEYTYGAIKHLMIKRGNKGLYISLNENVQPIELSNKYKNIGYLLKKDYGDKYLTIGTASESGTVRFDGEFEGKPKHGLAPMFKIFKRPKPIRFMNRGSINSYMKRIASKKKVRNNIMMMRTPQKNLLSYSSGSIKRDDKKIQNYNIVDNFDFMVYYFNTSGVHDIITKEAKEEKKENIIKEIVEKIILEDIADDDIDEEILANPYTKKSMTDDDTRNVILDFLKY